MKLEIRKKHGVEDLISGYTPKKVEHGLLLNSTGGKFTRLLRKFQKMLDQPDSISHPHQRIRDVLTPREIDNFLQLASIEKHARIRKYTGYFIDRLIQNSYDAGYNDFILHTPKLLEICSGLKGVENQLKVKVYGDIYSCGSSCNCVQISFFGESTSLGERATDSVFEAGDVGNIGTNAINCKFQAGKLKYSCGFSAIRSEFFVEEFGDCKRTYSCIFKTDRSDTLSLMLEKVPSFNREKTCYYHSQYKKVLSKNKIIFIHPDGREEVVRDYGEGSGS